MREPTISEILAANLKREMARRPHLSSQPALGKAAKVSQTSLSFILRPELRQPTTTGREPSATIVQVQKIAAALGCQAWELLMPAANGHEVTAGDIVRESAEDRMAPIAREIYEWLGTIIAKSQSLPQLTGIMVDVGSENTRTVHTAEPGHDKASRGSTDTGPKRHVARTLAKPKTKKR
jgi:hypothetical protein